MAKQGNSFEEDLSEHQQRTFRDIIDINKANEKLNQPGEPIIPEKQAPASVQRMKYQQHRAIMEGKEEETQ